MTKLQRQEHVLRRARELARTGNYSGYVLIEHALRNEGYPEARGWLDNQLFRQELDRLCAEARANEALS